MAVRAALVVALLASPARADVASRLRDTQEMLRVLDTLVEISYALSDVDELRRMPSQIWGELVNDPTTAALIDSIRSQYQGGFVRLSADAGVTADLDTPGAVTATLDASWDLPVCRVIGARATGLVGYADGDPLGSYAVTGTGCLPLPVNTFQVSYTRRQNVRATLLGPVAFGDRRRDHLVDLMVRFYRYRGTDNQVDIMPADIHLDLADSEGTGGLAANIVEIDVAPAAWRRFGKGFAGQDQIYRFLPIQLHAHGDSAALGGRDSSVMRITPVAIEGIGLGGGLALDVDVGFASAHVGRDMTTAFTRNDVYAEVGLDAQLAPVTAGVHASHAMLPTYGGQIIVQSRLAGRVTLAHLATPPGPRRSPAGPASSARPMRPAGWSPVGPVTWPGPCCPTST